MLQGVGDTDWPKGLAGVQVCCIRTELSPFLQSAMTELGIPVAPRGKRYYTSDNNRGPLRD